MKSRIIQYLLIITILSGITAGWFYFSSNAAQKINSSKVNNLTSGLVGYWTMDGNNTTWTSSTAGTVADSSGNGNTGTLTNMSQSTSPAIGKIGQAMSFDGSDDNISVANESNFDFGDSTSFSISAWIRMDSTVGDYDGIIGKASASSIDGFMLRHTTNGNLSMRVEEIGGTDQSDATANQDYRDDKWHHVVGVIDRANNLNIIYIDSVNKNQSSIASIGSLSNAYNLFLGAFNGGVKYKGKLDEVRVYSRALSQSEITELYQQGQTKINASETNKLTSGLIGYWPMDGNYVDWSAGDEKEIRDASGSGNHGDVANITQTDATPGKIGQGIVFNSSTDSITVTDSGSILDPLAGITVSAWVDLKNSDSSTISTILTKCSGSCGVNGFRFSLDNSNNCADVINGIPDVIFIYGNNSHCVEDVFLPNTGWHNLAATVSVSGGNAIYTFYLDGQQLGTPNAVGSFSNSDVSNNLTIGNRSPSYLRGSLDELRIYNRVLSESEITELYQQGQTKINASQANKLTNGLQGYWTFDGDKLTTSTATDSSANGYNGSLSGSPAPAIGKIGQALSFNGTSSVVTVSGATSPNLDITSVLTISAWIKPDVTGSTSWTGIVTKGTTAGNSYRMVYEDTSSYCSGNEVLVRFGANTGWRCSGLNSIMPNQWNHVVFTVDSDSWEIYTNNVLRDSGTGSYSKSASTADLLIGNYEAYFDGSIDEVRVYNRALSASEVTELYDMGR